MPWVIDTGVVDLGGHLLCRLLVNERLNLLRMETWRGDLQEWRQAAKVVDGSTLRRIQWSPYAKLSELQLQGVPACREGETAYDNDDENPSGTP